ncbi:MAG: phosphatidate cytidylyltransferase [Sphingopyxis sp.]
MRKSDLGVRTLTALAMAALVALVLWQGGLVFALFAGVVGIGVYWEMWGLVRRFTASIWVRAVWMVGGALYIGAAVTALVMEQRLGVFFAPTPLLIAAATDIGAYFAGRRFGGPKIAPRISPSKTWSGLLGGMVAAGAALVLLLNGSSAALFQAVGWWQLTLGETIVTFLIGAVLAIVAQAGDFLESGMKRAAGVKESGHLLPGHGGLFDRMDGMIAIGALLFIIAGLAMLGAPVGAPL